MKTKGLFLLLCLTLFIGCKDKTTEMDKESKNEKKEINFDVKFRTNSTPEEVFKKVVTLHNEYVNMTVSSARTSVEEEEIRIKKDKLYRRIDGYFSSYRINLFNCSFLGIDYGGKRIEYSILNDSKLDNTQLKIQTPGIYGELTRYIILFEKLNGEWKIYKSIRLYEEEEEIRKKSREKTFLQFQSDSPSTNTH